jgi:replicative superfamily II helicase
MVFSYGVPMVDFGELMGDEEAAAPIEPTELFRSLVTVDRLEYLRDVQQDVLRAWYGQRTERDTIVKMNTGAGKTIVGLLMLQSSLNEGIAPALYLCPTIQLVNQVASDARDLGIPAVTLAGPGQLPVEFDNGEAILIATFQKLFNGRSIFGVTGSGRTPIQVGAVLVDDAHSCLRIARETATVTIPSTSSVYSQLFSIFEGSLRSQSESQTAEIKQAHPWARLLIPHWAWQARLADVAGILAKNQESDELKFSWPLIKESLATCHCIFTGQKLEISPYLVPIRAIPSFANASRRFFLSATLADDSILPREFDVQRRAVEQTVRPSIRGDAGERMILVPDLIDPVLGLQLPKFIADNRGEYNIVVLVPSGAGAARWQEVGAALAMSDDVAPAIERLRAATGQFIVLANRYDGIDLPDDACRILIVDGLPIGDTLFDRYTADVRQNSLLAAARIAQTVEQGFGRGVRSGKDRCVVLLSGRELVRFVSMKKHLSLFSPETREQIEIGRQISKIASEEKSPSNIRLLQLMEQCLKGEEKWRKFHATRMSKVTDDPLDNLRLNIGVNERTALNAFNGGDHQEAVRLMRETVNAVATKHSSDSGWYLQLGAMFMHSADPTEGQQMQKRAHETDSALLKPMAGVRYRRVALKGGIQAERVLAWIREHSEPNAVVVAVEDILSRIAFGVEADAFEHAWFELGEVLGFRSQRPEKEFGKGPDELWAMPGNTYLLAEAKSDVKETRTEIYQSEAEQLSNSVNWFRNEYGTDANLVAVLIHPVSTLAHTAFPPEGSLVIDREMMGKLHNALKLFAAALAGRASDAWSASQVGQLLEDHELSATSFRSAYCKSPRRPS